MKRLLCIFLCILLLLCFSAPAVFADSGDLLDWAMEDQAEDVDKLDDAVEELARGAVKAMIILAAIVGASVTAIVVLVKKKAANKAIKAGAKAVGKATAGGNASASAAGSGTSGTGGVGDSYIVTDPVTGAQTLYIKDANGDWVSSDVDSVLDTDKNLVSSASDAAGDLVKSTSSKAIEKSFDKTFEDLNPNKD